ncbi:MAG: hypothetical protein KF724_09295 [Phycisphaeraceae bacterium]|nr:hypothetical protein [Phycisphaeraceae bacterium]
MRWSWLLLLLTLAGLGCDSRPPLADPIVLRSPLPEPQIWAVVPFSNESGVSTVDGAQVADQFVKVIEESSGLSCVALNRTLATMQILGMRAVLTHQDAARLREAMGVDGLVVGTVTAWNPYPPPTMALAAQLYLRPGVVIPASGLPARGDQPAAAASGSFDSSNHAVLANLRVYAAARHEPGGSYGEDIYLVSMQRYSEFACHEILKRLLETLAPPAPRR